jgi:hypothetical protein
MVPHQRIVTDIWRKYPQVDQWDIDKIEDADLPAIIDPILSEPSNYKLRTKFSKCSTDRGITITNKYLTVTLKFVIGVTVLFALIAGSEPISKRLQTVGRRKG